MIGRVRIPQSILAFAFLRLWSLRGFLLRGEAASEENWIMFSVTVEGSGQAVTLHALGKLLRGDETVLLCAAIRQHAPHITLDLSEVEAMDAAAIGALISLQAAGIFLTLANPTSQVRELFKPRLDSLFEIIGPEPGDRILRSQPLQESPSETGPARAPGDAFGG
jgi:ABC-type transporter Mla MlaB component